MKRYNNLYEKVISLDNLRLADEKARKGKLHTRGVQLHDQRREENIIALHDALVTKTFRTSTYSCFTVHEPKEREIYRLPYYPDRILHHAIMNVLESIWVRTFTYNTYSCVKKRGIHGCAKRVHHIINSYKGQPLYCLKIDVTKYYPSVNHNVLKLIVRRKIKDKDLLWLLDEIIDSTDGLPIGNYLSQYFANLYLCYFMHWANENLRVVCCEYADDIVFFSNNKEELHNTLARVKEYMEKELKLTLKGNYQIFPISNNKYDPHGRALDYVGYQFYRGQTLIRKSIKVKYCKRVAQLNKKHLTIDLYKREICSWLGWAKWCNSKHLLKKTIRPDYYKELFHKVA